MIPARFQKRAGISFLTDNPGKGYACGKAFFVYEDFVVAEGPGDIDAGLAVYFYAAEKFVCMGVAESVFV
jgi:hypothetical protein